MQINTEIAQEAEQPAAATNATSMMTITRALSRIKHLDEQIAGYFNTPRTLVAVVLGKAEKPMIAGHTKDSLESLIKSDHDRLQALIKQRGALKNAVIQSNAKVKLSIAGVEYTVAEAIELKRLLPVRMSSLRNYTTQLSTARKQVETTRGEMETRKNNLIQAQSTASLTEEDKAALSKRVTDDNEREFAPTLLDPIGLEAYIRKEMDAIEHIGGELDYQLSELNATTVISIPN